MWQIPIPLGQNTLCILLAYIVFMQYVRCFMTYMITLHKSTNICNHMVRITTGKKSSDCLKRRWLTCDWKCQDSEELSLDERIISTGIFKKWDRAYGFNSNG
jgi:hypothetical protein